MTPAECGSSIASGGHTCGFHRCSRVGSAPRLRTEGSSVSSQPESLSQDCRAITEKAHKYMHLMRQDQNLWDFKNAPAGDYWPAYHTTGRKVKAFRPNTSKLHESLSSHASHRECLL
jgi:hypothetical protein